MPRLLAALLALAPAALAPAGLAPAGLAAAAPTVSCHCFRDRSFDPADPGSADAYILADARSSLLSAVFGVSKGSLVRAVMGGTAPEDLWIAHWTAARTGRDAEALLSALSGAGSWRAALAGARGLPPAFAAALARDARPSELAALAVDDVVAARLGADAATLRALRGAGATSEQVIAAVFLSARLEVPAPAVLARFRAGAPWGTLLHEAGFSPEGIEPAMRAAVAGAPRAAAARP